MALDLKFRAFLEAPGAELLPPPEGVTAAMMRAAMKANAMPVAVPPIHATRDVTITF